MHGNTITTAQGVKTRDFAKVVQEVREVIAALPGPPQLRDLHVWRVGRGKYACIVHLSHAQEMHAAEVRSALAVHEELVHVTVEFER